MAIVRSTFLKDKCDEGMWKRDEKENKWIRDSKEWHAVVTEGWKRCMENDKQVNAGHYWRTKKDRTPRPRGHLWFFCLSPSHLDQFMSLGSFSSTNHASLVSRLSRGPALFFFILFQTQGFAFLLNCKIRGRRLLVGRDFQADDRLWLLAYGNQSPTWCTVIVPAPIRRDCTRSIHIKRLSHHGLLFCPSFVRFSLGFRKKSW